MQLLALGCESQEGESPNTMFRTDSLTATNIMFANLRLPLRPGQYYLISTFKYDNATQPRHRTLNPAARFTASWGFLVTYEAWRGAAERVRALEFQGHGTGEA
jgi:hypothetical protein